MARHVFLIDDEEDFVLSTTTLLGLEGFKVTSTTSSVDAVAWVREGRVAPDIVLLDHRMPVLTGPAALAQMRDAGLQAPAVLVSAMRDLESTAAAHNFDGYLSKPFGLSQLVQRIEQAIAARRAR
jgi:CheY-like chemotaxis protein